MSKLELPTSADLSGFGEGSDTLDLLGLWFVVLRRMRTILAIVVSTMAATLGITLNMPVEYRADARVLINPRAQEIIAPEIDPARQAIDSTLMDTEVQLVKSQGVLINVVRELELTRDPEFNPLLRKPSAFTAFLPGRSSKPKAAPATSTETDSASGTPIPNGAATAATEADIEVAAIAETLTANVLEDSVSAAREGLTYVIRITARSRDPEKAARIANAVTAAYIDGQVESKVGEKESAKDFLEERVAVLREDVRAAESAVEEFRNSRGLIEGASSSASDARGASLASQLVIFQTELVEKEAKLEEARRSFQNSPTTIGTVLDSPTLNTLRLQRSDLERKLADLSSIYQERHPERIRVVMELDQLKTAVASEQRRLLDVMESDVQVTRNRVAAINGEISSLNARAERNNIDMIRLRELEREAKTKRELYERVLARSAEVSEATLVQRADAFLIGAAEKPMRRSSPNHKINLLLGALVALSLAGLVVLIMELMETGFTNVEDVENTLGLSVVATVPEVKTSSLMGQTNPYDLITYLLQKPFSSYAEAIRNLYTVVHRNAEGKPFVVVAVASSLPGEGKTSLALSLARLAAERNKRVLLVDADVRRRSLTQLLRPDTNRGLISAIDGSANPLELVSTIDDQLLSLSFLPCNEMHDGGSAMFMRDDLRKVFNQLGEAHDIIVLDCPPVLPVLEARTFCASADIVLFATRWRKSHRKSVVATMKLLNSDQIFIHGLALTRTDLRIQALYQRLHGEHFRQYVSYYRN